MRSTPKTKIGIRINGFLIASGSSDTIQCNKNFDYACAEFIRIANRLKVIKGEKIKMKINELETEFEAVTNSRIFKIKKL